MTSQALFRISPRFFGQYQLHRPTQLVNGQTIKQDSIRSRVLLKTVRSIFRKSAMLELLQQCHLDQCTNKSHLQLKLVSSDGMCKLNDNDIHITDLITSLIQVQPRPTRYGMEKQILQRHCTPRKHSIDFQLIPVTLSTIFNIFILEWPMWPLNVLLMLSSWNHIGVKEYHHVTFSNLFASLACYWVISL